MGSWPRGISRNRHRYTPHVELLEDRCVASATRSLGPPPAPLALTPVALTVSQRVEPSGAVPSFAVPRVAGKATHDNPAWDQAQESVRQGRAEQGERGPMTVIEVGEPTPSTKQTSGFRAYPDPNPPGRVVRLPRLRGGPVVFVKVADAEADDPADSPPAAGGLLADLEAPADALPADAGDRADTAGRQEESERPATSGFPVACAALAVAACEVALRQVARVLRGADATPAPPPP
jgi:hypothetical protein